MNEILIILFDWMLINYFVWFIKECINIFWIFGVVEVWISFLFLLFSEYFVFYKNLEWYNFYVKVILFNFWVLKYVLDVDDYYKRFLIYYKIFVFENLYFFKFKK